VRFLLFHGYLLSGTGSNVYTAQLARALVALGAEVHLVCQDRAPFDHAFVDAAGDWDAGALDVRTRREPVRCTVLRPHLGGILPVYVADTYEGVHAVPYVDLDDAALEEYLERNVAAVREVARRVRPDAALAGHLIAGPAIVARALAGMDVPYAVKVHGSALEYAVARRPDRFVGLAREGLAGARAVLVGSRHIAQRLWSVLDDPALEGRTRLGPPGVDVETFRPRARAEARQVLRALGEELAGGATATGGALSDGAPASSFARDAGAAGRALARLDLTRDRLVVFVGKLIVSKGIDLLAAAWPLVVQRVPEARLVVVGFGAYRPALERMLGALADGDLAALRVLGEQGRAAEGGPPAPLNHLLAFLDALQADPPALEAYRRAGGEAGDRVVLTGRLDHPELARLLPACEAQVVPSTFPEAFGMVAAEAAACGVLPVCADHSGLAEVAGPLARAVPPEAARWLTVPVGPGTVTALADRLVAWLQAPAGLREATARALAATARERYSWEGVARGVLASARGDLGVLPPVPRD